MDWVWDATNRVYYSASSGTYAVMGAGGGWEYVAKEDMKPTDDKEEGEIEDDVGWGALMEDKPKAVERILRLVVTTSDVLDRGVVIIDGREGGVQIGRDRDNGGNARLRLKEMQVSKSHAVVYWSGDDSQWCIVDLGAYDDTTCFTEIVRWLKRQGRRTGHGSTAGACPRRSILRSRLPLSTSPRSPSARPRSSLTYTIRGLATTARSGSERSSWTPGPRRPTKIRGTTFGTERIPRRKQFEPEKRWRTCDSRSCPVSPTSKAPPTGPTWTDRRCGAQCNDVRLHRSGSPHRSQHHRRSERRYLPLKAGHPAPVLARTSPDARSRFRLNNEMDGVAWAPRGTGGRGANNDDMTIMHADTTKSTTVSFGARNEQRFSGD